jgi:hypothetical protein
MDHREIGLGGVDWIRLAEDRDRWQAVVSVVMRALQTGQRVGSGQLYTLIQHANVIVLKSK